MSSTSGTTDILYNVRPDLDKLKADAHAAMVAKIKEMDTGSLKSIASNKVWEKGDILTGSQAKSLYNIFPNSQWRFLSSVLCEWGNILDGCELAFGKNDQPRYMIISFGESYEDDTDL